MRAWLVLFVGLGLGLAGSMNPPPAGAAWSPSTEVASVKGYAKVGGVARLDDGRVVVVWARLRPGTRFSPSVCFRILATVGRVGGRFAAPQVLADAYDGEAAGCRILLKRSLEGRLVLAWSASPGPVQVAALEPSGRFTKPETVAEDGELLAVGPSTSRGASIAWNQPEQDNSYAVRFADWWPGQVGPAIDVVAAPAVYGPDRRPVVSIGSGGTAVVAWNETTVGARFVARSAAGGWSEPRDAGLPTGLPEGPLAAVAGDRILVSNDDSEPGREVVSGAGVAVADSAAGPALARRFDRGGNRPRQTSLVGGPDGRALFTWTLDAVSNRPRRRGAWLRPDGTWLGPFDVSQPRGEDGWSPGVGVIGVSGLDSLVLPYGGREPVQEAVAPGECDRYPFDGGVLDTGRKGAAVYSWLRPGSIRVSRRIVGARSRRPRFCSFVVSASNADLRVSLSDRATLRMRVERRVRGRWRTLARPRPIGVGKQERSLAIPELYPGRYRLTVAAANDAGSVRRQVAFRFPD